jgi:hypothetical protein
MKLKYIVFKNEQAILFGEDWAHGDFLRFMDVRSAGFVSINSETREANCFGKSVSLGVESMPEEDKRIIDRILNPLF